MTLFEKLEGLRITASSEIAPHEFLFKWNDTPCFARGELVAVTGKAKSGKTYLNSLLMAAAGGLATEVPSTGQRGHSFLGLRRINEMPLRVLWIDTEQSEDTTCEILRDRIGAMIGEAPSDEMYHVFNLRQIQWQDRIELVLVAIANCQPDLVIFDGIRDVVGDINNYDEAQRVIGQLLAVASTFHTCIVSVLHQNKAAEDKTLRGALGTELQNKSYETYECAKDADTRIFTIKQTATRKYDMPNKVQFIVSAEGLPIPCATPEEGSDKGRPAFNPEYVTDGKIDQQRLLQAALQDRSMTWTELKGSIMDKANICSPRFAETLITEARDAGLIKQILCDDGRRRYTLSA